MAPLEPIPIELTLFVPEADAIYLDEQVRLLRRDLEQLGITTSAMNAPAPSGARGAAELLGLLQIVLLPTLGPKLFDLLQTWLASRKDSIVKLKISRDEIDVEFSPEHTHWKDIDALINRTAKRLTP